MVVVDPILVAGRRACGLDAPDKPPIGEDPEGVVYRLTGDGPDLGADACLDVIGRPVRGVRHGPKDRQSLSRYLHTALSEESGGIGERVGHGHTMSPILDSVKNRRFR